MLEFFLIYIPIVLITLIWNCWDINQRLTKS